MRDDIAISVKNISKSFRLPHEKHSSLKDKAVHIFGPRKFTKFKALEEISFDIKKGEFFGIVGKNGSGKSTLLKIIANIYQPTKGSVGINGSLAPFIELGVGFNPELTGRENVFLSGTILGMTRKKIELLYDEIVAFAELEEFMDQKLKNYSSGMQVRLAFSIAVRAESDILLIDEVLAVGDSSFQQKCFDYFNKLKKSNKTIILVTHDMLSVQKFCDRCALIDSGSLLSIGKPDLITNEYLIMNTQINQKATNTNSNEELLNLTIEEPNNKNKNINIYVKYKRRSKSKVIVGLSIIKDGNSVAEINSKRTSMSTNGAELSYELDTSILNPGIYELSAALIDLESGIPVATTPDRKQFVLEGSDDTRGGAIKLANRWRVL